jgi:hypothetical protein
MKARNFLLAIAVASAWGWAAPAAAHCDTLDGPVVGAAHRALETGQVEHALIWVQKADERAIREAYAKARAAHAAGGPTAERADAAFYATLVRLHRKGEGAPYTGLKPAGHVEPPIAAADSALASGHRGEVEKLLVERTQAGLRERFDAVAQKKSFAPADVDAGRAYVGAYVDYVHYVERIYDAAAPEANAHAAHEHNAPEPKSATRATATPAARHGH